MIGKGKLLLTLSIYAVALTCNVCIYAAEKTGNSPSCQTVEDIRNSDGDQKSMNICANEARLFQDNKMNKLYNQQMERLGSENKALLRNAQRSWINFRDKACLYEVGRCMPGTCGTEYSFKKSLCLTELTTQQIQNLERYWDCTVNDCPN